jgi:hypothetical protein
MTVPAVQDRNGKAAEYLQLLRSLAGEMETAMQAIARNALPDIEESVAAQQSMSARLVELADELSAPLRSSPAASSIGIDEDLRRQILVSGDALQTLNRRYAALLQHSSRSVALMVSLFSSFKGQFKEASGPRMKHQTWSCQM